VTEAEIERMLRALASATEALQSSQRAFERLQREMDQIEEIVALRQRTLDTAYAAHPERFARRPIAKRPPTTVYINPPLEVNSPDTSL
jgi:ATP-dependent helicase YprA (DUF1998 family)